MKRYLVQDWYYDELGKVTLIDELLFKTETRARVFASRLRRKLNGFHAVHILVMRVTHTEFLLK